MAVFTRNQTIVAYYNKSKTCIEDARVLFEQGKVQNYGTLLLQGLELLFKSFILAKDNSTTGEILKREYGHNYYKAYQRCLVLDDSRIISSSILRSEIEFLYTLYEDDYTKLRYPSRDRIRHLPKDIFKRLETDFISPMERLIQPIYALAFAEEGPIKDFHREMGIKKEFDR